MTEPQQLDTVLKDIVALSAEIEAHHLLKTTVPFRPSVKWEDREPAEALEIISLYFRDYHIFDEKDLHAMKQLQAMKQEAYDMATSGGKVV